jgi:hypothetical protein
VSEQLTPDPDVFHPDVAVSNPGFFTKLTVRDEVLVLPPSLPVTVCCPPAFAVHTFRLHEPSGEMEKVVDVVTSPTVLPKASKPWAV